jgi:3-oxoadipate enol-lactonase
MEYKTRDGTRLAYALFGDPNSPSKIALVHSLAMDRAFWTPVAERLAAGACVLTYDCRGHGASDKPAGPYRVELFADDLAQLADALGWSKLTLAGASMGGCVALAFAQAQPQRLTGLGLFDTTAWYGPQAPKAWAERADKALSEGLSSLVDFQLSRWFSDGFRAKRADVASACVEAFLANDLKAYAETCRMLGACDLRSGLARITAPTRILVGEEDYATPVAMAQTLHEQIAGSTLRVVNGARHLTPLEIPDDVAEELRKIS